MQTVKDINQSLVDDFLVLTDKIGAGNFFWSFPSKAYHDQCTLRDSLNAQIVKAKENCKELESHIEIAGRERSDPSRKKKLLELEELKLKEANLDSQLELLRVNDPEEIKRIEKLVQQNKASADRWTDNIWQVKSYLTKRKGMSGKDVRITRLSALLFSQNHFIFLKCCRWINCCR